MPTVTTESILFTSITDVKENRDIVVIGVPNAFIKTSIKEKKDMAIIKLRGVFVEILCNISPKYKPYVTKVKKGFKHLLVHYHNTLCGTMLASLLYYCKLTKSLIYIGFEINPYDMCFTNEVIEGSQTTICFHVDDCKLSHCKRKKNDCTVDLLC